MTRIPLLAAALLGTTLFSTVPAQIQAFGGSFPRMSTRLLYFGETGPLGQICIQYGQPEWKVEYDQMLTTARGTSQRLGRDFWTSIDTDMDLTIGGTKVPAGHWYLGLRIDEKGTLHLMVMEAAAVRAEKADASGTSNSRARINAPLQLSRTEEQVDNLTITLDSAGKETGQADLILTWGRYKMTAAILADLDTGDNHQPPKPARIH